jgi:uridine kinase
MSRDFNSILAGISGLSGSGKTFMIEHLRQRLGKNACFISLDDYYKPYHQQAKDANGITNFDLPDALESDRFFTDVENLMRGRPVLLRKYQFENFDAEEQFEELHPAPIVVAEGLFVFHFAAVRNLMSRRFFIETDLELSLQRRLNRDTLERGIPLERSRYQWDNHVMPGYTQYVLPYRDACDLIIQNHGDPEENLIRMERSLHEALTPEALARLHP